ncbi:MAG: zinc-ribbon domain-containing protein [Methanobrevibacter sp.]|uniref:zinc-ribbon domain-containing protein n=1 Tax=Methanobrevibacter sp. TaxID=66852 RepID=UPI002E772837|nr:zinc-ribbon domain-containing protein [Methanobrevibacter sp.]MEE0934132.1 zinc-ribbon domain-containing protein [Methanobrevibacter sp.]
MVQYCRKCGQELDDDAEFCDSCGFNLNDNPTEEKPKVIKVSENKPTEVKNDKSEFINKLPLILAIIAIIVGVGEGLGTPMLMGWNDIMIAIAIAIAGGLIGIFLMEKMNEPLIAAAEFIVTGALIYMFIGRFGEISAILFIVAAILALYFKGMHYTDKRLWAIPILTFALIFVMLIAGGAVYQVNAENSIAVGNITQNITDDGYGYYSGEVSGDLRVDTNFDYLEVTVNYYDSQGKVIDSTIGWNDLNPESGKTYKFGGYYFSQQQPSIAEIKVVDSAKSTTPLYTENITIMTSSGV